MTRKDKFLMRMYNANLYLRREDNANFFINMAMAINEIGDISDFIDRLTEIDIKIADRNFRIFNRLKEELNSLPVDL